MALNMKYLNSFDQRKQKYNPVVRELPDLKYNIKDICDSFNIINYSINNDNTVDVDGSVNLNGYGLTEFPIKFRRINGHFTCSDNKFESLKGGPQYISGFFSAHHNNLKSLKGAPNYIGDAFFCHNNNLKTFEYFPEYVGNNVSFTDNPINEIWKLFRDTSKIELFNDYDIIQENKIIIERLNSFLEEIDKPIVNYHYLFDYFISV